MSQINIKNLTFAYDGSYDNIFENISLQIDTDWKLGITGRNGRGKTTLLQLLCGNHSFHGTISSYVNFDYFPFAVGDKNQNTVDLLESIHPFEHWRLLREFNSLSIDESVLTSNFSTLSEGEQTKVLLAFLFIKENNFLLIDEPTNHLDSAGRETVANYLATKKSFIVVSHDRTFLDKSVDHIMSINKNNIDIQKGNFSSWFVNKQRQDNFEMTENEKLKSEISRLQEANKRTENWSDKAERTKNGVRISGLRPDRGFIGRKSAKMMQSAKNLEKRQNNALDQKSSLLKNIEKADELKLLPLPYRFKPLVTIKDLSVRYGEKMVFDNLNFEIEQGDKVVLTGKNGCGKSTLLKLIANVPTDAHFSGMTSVGSDVKISYVPQNTDFLCGNLSDYAKGCGIDESLFMAILRKLDFSRLQFEKDIKDFSGGQKKKVLIAGSLCQKAHLYIWDEPLNFIDIFSRMQIENLLLQSEITILFVEHDKAFTDKIATKAVEF